VVDLKIEEYTLSMNYALAEPEQTVRIRPDRPMSDEELMRFCEDNDIARIERDTNGELLLMSAAGNRTGRTNAYVIHILTAWAEEDGRGYCFDSSTGFTLPDGSMRMPDASWVEAKRWDAMSEADQDRFSPICPEFVIEIRSKSDRLKTLQTKMEMWIANGAEVAWLIDPQRKVVEIYRPGDSPEVLHEPSSVQGSGPVAGFELVMARVWQ
jgi:Uma2 family endonuclease